MVVDRGGGKGGGGSQMLLLVVMNRIGVLVGSSGVEVEALTQSVPVVGLGWQSPTTSPTESPTTTPTESPTTAPTKVGGGR